VVAIRTAGRFRIQQVRAREILDSRGEPTIEVEVTTGAGIGVAAIPAGASTGRHEALELRDGDRRRYDGRGVLRAVQHVEGHIASKLRGWDVRAQARVDRLLMDLDGTPNKARLGANTLLGVSLAVAHAAAQARGLPLFHALGGEAARILPVPLLNVINGGRHAANELAFQEFMVIPVGFDRFREALRAAAEVYRKLKHFLAERYGPGATNVGDEGGFAPPMRRSTEALAALSHAVRAAGYRLEDSFFLGLDAAASEFYDAARNRYRLDGRTFEPGALIEYYRMLGQQYPLLSLEDPLHEDDMAGTAQLTKALGRTTQVVGDDLFVTNVARLRRGIRARAGNALLLKVNQIGTVTEARQAAQLAQRHGYRVVVSHRSGETEDTSIADIAVGWRCQQIKTGAPARGERTAKYNRLLRIEELLGAEARYLGRRAFPS
jgi:enolase